MSRAARPWVDFEVESDAVDASNLGTGWKIGVVVELRTGPDTPGFDPTVHLANGLVLR